MPKNLFIVWSKNFESHIPIIDEQHRGLVSTVNSLFYLMREHRTFNVIIPTIAALNHFKETHFYTEEYLMELTSYPQIEEHKKEHDVFRVQTKRLFFKSKKTLDPSELLDFIKKWWLEHVRVADLAYESHLRDILRKMGTL